MEAISESPYLQHFTELSDYREASSFDAGTLILFHKRATMDTLTETNEFLPVS